jgi:hypothetical protein
MRLQYQIVPCGMEFVSSFENDRSQMTERNLELAESEFCQLTGYQLDLQLKYMGSKMRKPEGVAIRNSLDNVILIE